MRDPKRIKNVLERIRQLWQTYPDLRLGQLIINVTTREGGLDLFYIEDDALIKMIEDYYNDISNRT